MDRARLELMLDRYTTAHPVMSQPAMIGMVYGEMAEMIRAFLAPPAADPPAGEARSVAIAAQIVRDVSELPDRTSPDYWPQAMLVTGDELASIVLGALSDDTRPAELTDAEVEAACVVLHGGICWGAWDNFTKAYHRKYMRAALVAAAKVRRGTP